MPKVDFEDLPEVKKSNVLTFEDLPVNQEAAALSFDDLPDITPLSVPEAQPPPGTQAYPHPVIAQFFKSAFRETPFGKRVLETSPEREKFYAELPSAKTIPEKISSGLGALVGMLPSFAVGGLGGSAVGAKITSKLASKLPRLAKYFGAAGGGAATFTGAKALRNIGQDQPITQGLPEEAAMGAVFGPTGLIRSYPKAIATSAGLGALVAPEGEKLSTGILFGGLTALTHRRPDFSVQDKAQIDALYNEAITKEGVRQAMRIVMPKALPAPKNIYGEGFQLIGEPHTPFPAFTQLQITAQSPAQLQYQPTLGKGAVRTGRGFTVTGGKQVARPLARGVAQELRTTPSPEQVIALTQPQVSQEIIQIRKPRVVNGVVVTRGDLEPISKTIPEGSGGIAHRLAPKGGEVEKYSVEEKKLIENRLNKAGTKKYSFEQYQKVLGDTQIDYLLKFEKAELSPTEGIKTPEIEITQTPTKFYAKIKTGTEWKVPATTVSLKAKTDIVYKSMTSDKAVKEIQKSLKKVTRYEEIIDEGGNKFTIIEGEGGFVNLSALEPAAEYARSGATKIYRNIAPAGEVLRTDKVVTSIMQEYQRKLSEIQSGQVPPGLMRQRQQELLQAEKLLKTLSAQERDQSVFVTRAANAIDTQRAFNKKYFDIVDLADKAGITAGSKASETVFKALDYRRATPEEIAKLTPEQHKFIPIFRNAYKEIWQATGKPGYEAVRDYATHLIQTGKEMGYDVTPFGRFLPDELYTRFFQQRRGAVPYKQDIIEAFNTYVPSVSRKIFREPVLDKANEIMPFMGNDLRNEALDFMEFFLGRGKYRTEYGTNVPKDLVYLTYQGTLYGNFSAATKNATQVLTNTIPEIGIKSTVYGYRKLMTLAGRQEFVNSQLAGDFSLGKPIDQLDFFSQVEFVNRGVTYLGAKNKALLEGKSPLQAENYARGIVRKTQFIQSGIDVPKLYRQYGSVGRVLGQFTQFPTKQGFLIYNWAKNGQWNKVARFATIAYLLGGTRTVPFLDWAIDKLPDEQKKLVKEIEKYTSLAGLSGMDIGQNFGLGIYSSGVPFARGPVASTVTEMLRFGRGVKTGEITTLQDIIRSRLVQKSLPTYIPGGVAMKKIIDLINLDMNDYKLRNAYNNLQYISSPKEEILGILVGPTRERQEAWRSIFEEKDEADRYRNEHRKMLDYILDSKGDTMALEEFVKHYPDYDIGKVVEELEARAKKRELPQDVRQFMRKPKALSSKIK